jgi:hypothetical protein
MDFNFKPKDLNSNKGDFETRFLRCKERFKYFWMILRELKINIFFEIFTVQMNGFWTPNKYFWLYKLILNIKIISIKFILNEKMKSFSKFEFLLKKGSHSEI